MDVGLTIGTGTSDLNIVAKHLELAESQDLEFVELSVYDWNIICGRKIISSELNKLIKICKNRKFKFTVHGELSVNFLDRNNLDLHKEVLKKDIEIASAIEARHLVTHFGVTTKNIFNNPEEYKSLLDLQREVYSELGDFAKSHNVILAVENLFNFYDDNMHIPLPNVLTEQLKILNHPNVSATLDFSHAYLNCSYYKADFMNEISLMSQISKHLHVHDSFGNLNNMYTYNESEDLSYGFGDLHLPLGWGDIPFKKIFEELIFPKDCILNLEIQERFIEYIPDTIGKAKILANKARIIDK